MGPNWDLIAWLIAVLFVLFVIKWVHNGYVFRRWERACEEAYKAQNDFIQEVQQSSWDHTVTRTKLAEAIVKWEALCRIRKMPVHEEHVAYLKNLQADFEQAQTS